MYRGGSMEGIYLRTVARDGKFKIIPVDLQRYSTSSYNEECHTKISMLLPFKVV
jgi:hypothetical protein